MSDLNTRLFCCEYKQINLFTHKVEGQGDSYFLHLCFHFNSFNIAFFVENCDIVALALHCIESTSELSLILKSKLKFVQLEKRQ